jgi:hypothetical protein
MYGNLKIRAECCQMRISNGRGLGLSGGLVGIKSRDRLSEIDFWPTSLFRLRHGAWAVDDRRDR